MGNEIYGKSIASTYEKLLFTKDNEGVSGSGSSATYVVTNTDGSDVLKTSVLSLSTSRVGVGNESPSKTFHAYHATDEVIALIESGDATASLCLKDSSTTANDSVGIGALGDDFKIYAASNGAERMRILGSNGKVGIGVTNPQALLSVNNEFVPVYGSSCSAIFEDGVEINGNNDVLLDIKSRSTEAGGTSSFWRFLVDGDSGRLDIQSGHSTTTGNSPIIIEKAAPDNSIYIHEEDGIGINLAAPTAYLHVKSTSTSSIQKWERTSNIIGLEISASASGGWGMYDHIGSAYDLFTKAGRMAIGGSSSPVYTLEVKSRTNADSVIYIDTTDANSGTADSAIIFAEANVWKWTLINDGSGADQIKIYPAGDGDGCYIAQTGTVWLTLSDRRIKENIVDLDKGLDCVMAMKPRRFNFNDLHGGLEDIGFIAQEMQSILPEVVDGNESDYRVVDGKEEGIMGLSQQKIVPVLVKAIQELSDKITALENA